MLPFVCCLMVAAAPPAAEYPKLELKTPTLAATVYLPDSKAGHYRGTRFSWGGQLGHVKFGKHTLFNAWKGGHNPANNDDIVGPADEFDMETPPGYAAAKVGDHFLKIGVGDLVKAKDEKYQFYHNYTIATPAPWEVKSDATSVTLTQKFDSKTGVSYTYAKTISLGDGGKFTIFHSLTNRGPAEWKTTVYNHNFLNVNDDPVGPNYALAFPFAPTAAAKERFAEVVKVAGRDVRFAKPLDTGSIYAVLTGYGTTPADAGFTLTHTSGLTLTATGDRPLAKLAVWGIKTCLCPEPFVEITVKPGGTETWKWAYELAAK